MQLKENATGAASAQESQRGVVASLVYVFEQVMPDPPHRSRRVGQVGKRGKFTWVPQQP